MDHHFLETPYSVQRKRRTGFTLIELLIAIFIIAVLIGILLTALGKARRSAENVKCLSNLRQIAMAFHLYAIDEGGKLPAPAFTDSTWERVISKYVSSQTEIFQCPTDEEIFSVIGTSYDWRDTGDDTTSLAGKSITSVKRMETVLAYEALPGWHRKKRMNAARIDGSAEEMTQEQCLTDISTPIR